MICTILYLENSDKSIFEDLKKRVENDYALNKSECPRTVTVAQSLLLNYQTNLNYNRKFQSLDVRNQLMFAYHGKNGYCEGETKDNKKKPWRNLEHITARLAISN